MATKKDATGLVTASVLAFERKLDPSDALFFAGAWEARGDSAGWPAVEVRAKSVRGTISNRLKTKDADPAKLDAAIQNPNLQTVDVAALPAEADTLKVTFTLRVLGGESSIAAKVGELFDSVNPTVAIYCKTGESEIRVTARAATAAEAEAACRRGIEQVRARLGDAAYDVDVPGLEYTLVRLLQQKNLRIATAESCTGGLVAERLTNVPGASRVFGYGFVTYAEAAKEKLLGVSPALIARYNVASGPVAAAMAFGALRASGAALAVGITGIAGPGGALPGKPVGTVYLAGADGRTGKGWLLRLPLSGYPERAVVRARAALYALDLLRRMALELPVPGALPFAADTAPGLLDL